MDDVAPFTGAWIEMGVSPLPTTEYPLSHPSRVRGLKFVVCWRGCGYIHRRTLHGCVD